ncbi:MAG: XdhC/CoxI family protein [bacterium]|nr:XdhC/CoxI family protein [bacterium]
MNEEAMLFERIAAAARAGRPVALAVVTGTSRSSPRKAGARMLVHADGSTFGTIGGGVLESLVIEEARKAIAAGAPVRLEYSLDPEDPDNITMCCGGEVEIFVDVIRTQAPIVILGGGHVGERIARVAEAIGIPYIVADDRAAYASRERFPAAADVCHGPFGEALSRIPVTRETFVVICTHGHAHDLLCLREALRTEAAYIGVIASRGKAERFRRQIEEEGVVRYDDRVYSPIGLDLGDSSPGQIALSVMAEIVGIRSGGTAAHKRLAVEPPAADVIK